MNEHQIPAGYYIKGKTKHYYPFNVLFPSDRYSLSLEIIEVYEHTFRGTAVFTYKTEFAQDIYFKVKFYKNFTPADYDDSAHAVYFLKSSEVESKKIIEDIEQSEKFKK